MHAPMPTPSVTTDAAVNPGDRINCRAAKRRSFMRQLPCRAAQPSSCQIPERAIRTSGKANPSGCGKRRPGSVKVNVRPSASDCAELLLPTDTSVATTSPRIRHEPPCPPSSPPATDLQVRFVVNLMCRIPPFAIVAFAAQVAVGGCTKTEDGVGETDANADTGAPASLAERAILNELAVFQSLSVGWMGGPARPKRCVARASRSGRTACWCTSIAGGASKRRCPPRSSTSSPTSPPAKPPSGPDEVAWLSRGDPWRPSEP